MNIKGKKVTLCAMEPQDCGLIVEMFNDPEIENLVVGWSFPLSEFAQRKWLESHYNDQKNLRFVIKDEEGRSLGVATLVDIDWKNRCATYGIKIAKKEDRGRGIGKDTVMAIMRYAFDELQLHRLETTYFPDNRASQGVFLNCGWKEEGIKRSCVFKGGRYRDLVVCGILAEDYYTLIEENHYWDE